MRFTTTRRGLLRYAAVVGVAALALAGCASNNNNTTTATGDTDADAALAKGGNLLVWSWEPTLKNVVAQFQKDYPNVHVDLVNAGTGGKQYSALANAIQAGSGIPDVAHVEYQVIPQFVFTKGLADLTPYGAGSLDGTFTPGPWNGVKVGGKIYGLPMDSGPMALFYNDAVFKKYNVNVPKTWDEYLDAARKLHAADPNVYIANDTGDAGFTTSMIWQASGRPFKVDGTNVKIDFSDAGTKKFADLWQKLIDEKLLAPIGSWSDAWNKGLGDGTIATLTIGAWMPANLESGAPAGKGNWRVTDMAQWSSGQHVAAENGGSSLAVLDKGTNNNKALAYAFVRYATTGKGAAQRAQEGAFPATTADLASAAFLDKEFAYFGGQKVNQVLAQAAKNVATGWQYLPYQSYANDKFNDTVGKAYTGSTKLLDGLNAWAAECKTYGSQQGFTIG